MTTLTGGAVSSIGNGTTNTLNTFLDMATFGIVQPGATDTFFELISSATGITHRFEGTGFGALNAQGVPTVGIITRYTQLLGTVTVATIADTAYR
jgi:hypothetical protein